MEENVALNKCWVGAKRSAKMLFRHWVLELAEAYREETGHAPNISYDASKGIYGGAFVRNVEWLLSVEGEIADALGYRPGVWRPASPLALGKAIQRILKRWPSVEQYRASSNVRIKRARYGQT
jgi:hypothetical protein